MYQREKDYRAQAGRSGKLPRNFNVGVFGGEKIFHLFYWKIIKKDTKLHARSSLATPAGHTATTRHYKPEGSNQIGHF